MLESFKYIAEDSIRDQKKSWRNFFSRLFIKVIGQSPRSKELDALIIENMEAGLRLIALDGLISNPVTKNFALSRNKIDFTPLPEGRLLFGKKLSGPLTVSTSEDGWAILLEDGRGNQQIMICLIVRNMVNMSTSIAEIYSESGKSIKSMEAQQSINVLIYALAGQLEIIGRIPIPQSSIDDINK